MGGAGSIVVGEGGRWIDGSGAWIRGLRWPWIRGYFHLREALNEVGRLQAPGDLKIETLLVKNSSLVDKLRVNGDAVGERAVQALKRVHLSLQTAEEVAHFFCCCYRRPG